MWILFFFNDFFFFGDAKVRKRCECIVIIRARSRVSLLLDLMMKTNPENES